MDSFSYATDRFIGCKSIAEVLGNNGKGRSKSCLSWKRKRRRTLPIVPYSMQQKKLRIFFSCKGCSGFVAKNGFVGREINVRIKGKQNNKKRTVVNIKGDRKRK